MTWLNRCMFARVRSAKRAVDATGSASFHNGRNTDFMRYTSILLFLLLFGITLTAPAQAQHAFGISGRFAQIREELNNDMVFDGPELLLQYRYRSQGDGMLTEYRASLGGGTVLNRGILGISARITPLDYLRGVRVLESGGTVLYAGLRALVGYHLQIYPDLQIGHDFWLSEASLAPAAELQLRSGVRIRGSVSLLAAVSRTPARRDPYWFSLNALDILSDMHSDIALAGPDSFLHAALEAEYPLTSSGNWMLGYGLDFLTYRDQPGIDMLHHAVSITHAFGE